MEIIENLCYLSKIPGIGGSIKKDNANFIVEEIDNEGFVYTVDKKVKPKWTEPEEYTIIILQKKDWTTHQAIKAIRKRLGIGNKRISYAGTKDRKASTTQQISVYRLPLEKVEKISIKDIKILGAWYWDNAIEMGDLLGNRFAIGVKTDFDWPEKRVNDIYSELGGLSPNYFGEQRFGMRENTHTIGKKIVKRDFKGAVLDYLTESSPLEPGEVRHARAQLALTLDYKEALKDYPLYLRYERTLIDHLSKNENDYVGALRRIQRTLSLMFVHAYQSYLFNKMLNERIKEIEGAGSAGIKPEPGEYKCGMNWYSFPEITRINGKFVVGKIIGYETEVNEREEKILEIEEISKEDFKIKSFPELSSKGTYRSLFVPIKDLSFKKNKFKFELPSGSYATIAMREFINAKK